MSESSQKIQWKPGNMVYPLPAVIVTCKDQNGCYNAITIAWTGTFNTDPPYVYIAVKPTRHSYQMIKDTGVFVINLTTEAMAFATDFCGVRSGRDVDKLNHLSLKYTLSDSGVPMLLDAPVCIVCQVDQMMTMGSHHQFIAKVVDVFVDPTYMDDNNRFCLNDAKPITYCHGHYYGLGKPLGRFGYSVMKKKIRRKGHK